MEDSKITGALTTLLLLTISLAIVQTYLASIIVVFDHRDNGQCQHQSILRDVSCALLGNFVFTMFDQDSQPAA